MNIDKNVIGIIDAIKRDILSPILPPAVAELPCIGLLLCKKKDRLSVEWALKAVNVPVGVASYEVSHRLPTEEKSTDLSQ